MISDHEYTSSFDFDLKKAEPFADVALVPGIPLTRCERHIRHFLYELSLLRRNIRTLRAPIGSEFMKSFVAYWT
jgi:hypothetical protein